MKCPCKGCEHRTITPNCHMSCPPYLAYHAARDRINEKRREEREIIDALVTGAQKIKREVYRKTKIRK